MPALYGSACGSTSFQACNMSFRRSLVNLNTGGAGSRRLIVTSTKFTDRKSKLSQVEHVGKGLSLSYHVRPVIISDTEESHGFLRAII